MPQLDYGDYYKFVASTGIALIGAAVALPLLILRESFDLAIEASKLAALTPEARNVIIQRQHAVVTILVFTPYAAALLGFLGVSLFLYGVLRWRRRQAIRDKAEELGVDKLTRELAQMTPEEVQQGARQELEAEEESHPSATGVAATSEVVSAYLRTESELLDKIAMCYGPSARLEKHKRLGNIEYDAILTVPPAERIILEIKYIRKGFKRGWLLESCNALMARVALYCKTFSRRTRAVLIIILAPTSNLSSEGVEELIDELTNLLPERLAGIKIRVIDEREVASIQCEEIERLLEH